VKRILSVILLVVSVALLAQAQIAIVTLPDNEAAFLPFLTMLALSPSWPTQGRPAGFDFALIGVEGRVASFVDPKGRTLRSRCEDCLFLIAESGVEDPLAVPNPGIVFKVTTNGQALSATCRATECLIILSDGTTASRLSTTQTIPSNRPVYFRVMK
jgi:hypothetical protein